MLGHFAALTFSCGSLLFSFSLLIVLSPRLKSLSLNLLSPPLSTLSSSPPSSSYFLPSSLPLPLSRILSKTKKSLFPLCPLYPPLPLPIPFLPSPPPPSSSPPPPLNISQDEKLSPSSPSLPLYPTTSLSFLLPLLLLTFPPTYYLQDEKFSPLPFIHPHPLPPPSYPPQSSSPPPHATISKTGKSSPSPLYSHPLPLPPSSLPPPSLLPPVLSPKTKKSLSLSLSPLSPFYSHLSSSLLPPPQLSPRTEIISSLSYRLSHPLFFPSSQPPYYPKTEKVSSQTPTAPPFNPSFPPPSTNLPDEKVSPSLSSPYPTLFLLPSSFSSSSLPLSPRYYPKTESLSPLSLVSPSPSFPPPHLPPPVLISKTEKSLFLSPSPLSPLSHPASSSSSSLSPLFFPSTPPPRTISQDERISLPLLHPLSRFIPPLSLFLFPSFPPSPPSPPPVLSSKTKSLVSLSPLSRPLSTTLPLPLLAPPPLRP
ncbi:hypothetical protein C7M84_003413 [Penaeus vannamei]|uniref:Uncharacterized protein n=1 Tax=Penaeus vannamei TaxID=6689 RepID=A0A423TN69_PENVA|nr:hypothetical protein C7M84_003413 [Penaeus vannamei]